MTSPLIVDEITWINQHLAIGPELNYEQMKPILCFSLIWNLFETETCKRNAGLISIRKSVELATSSGGLASARYSPFLDYFRTRYLTDEGNFDDFFDRLMLTNKEAQQVVKQALTANVHDIQNTVYALLLIAHRIRNNFFHGNKDVASLPQQAELFSTINALLTTYLEDFAKSQASTPHPPT